MDQDFSIRPGEARSTSSRGRAIIAVAVAAFLLGGALTFYLVRSIERSGNGIFDLWSDSPPASPAAVEPSPLADPPAATDARAQQAAEQVERVVVQQGGIDQRVAAMEQRLTRLDLQAQAAAGNAARAEGLLIAFATRRAIERGAPLGYLADQLRLRFGDARPNSVQIVIQASRDPVTLDRLLARLEGLRPQLEQAPANEGAVAWLSRELGELFVVRREDAPSPAAERRLERARLFLESGRTEAAIAEIRHLPNAVAAADWLSDAERYAATQQALELLETTAILEPRELRDGSGNPVEQISPASERAN